jgi:hypothetical protein
VQLFEVGEHNDTFLVTKGRFSKVRVIGDTDLSYCLPNTLATRNGNFDLPELIEYLLRVITFSWHFCLSSICPLSGLSDGHV